MKSIKCSLDISKNGSCGHDDRTTTQNARNIDTSRSHLNKYWNYYEDNSLTFSQVYRKFYEERYSATIEAQNQRNIKASHPERNKTIDDYLKDDRTKPYHFILQLGNQDNKIDDNLASETMQKWIDKISIRYPNLILITDAEHRDEKNLHHHLAVVFDYKNDDGVYIINQTKALEEMGFERPDPSAPVSRYNNVMMTFTKELREDFERFAQENLPYEIDQERVPNRYNVVQEEYIRNKNRDLMKVNRILEKQNDLVLEKQISLKKLIEELIQRILGIMHSLEERYPIVLENIDIPNFNPIPEWSVLAQQKELLDAEIKELDELSELGMDIGDYGENILEDDEWELEY